MVVPKTVAKLLVARAVDDDKTVGTEYAVSLGKAPPVTIKTVILA